MSGDNKCASCGQFSGRGHRCPPPMPVVTPNGEYHVLPTLGVSHSDTADRVARAQEAIRDAAATASAEGMVRAIDLKPGDLVDLQGDPYADPDEENTLYQYEYGLVMEVDQETDDCVAISIEGVDTIGFPVDHRLRKMSVD